MSAQLVNYLRILEIEEETIPKMKIVRKQFLKLSKLKHPDKGLGSSEDFKELLEAKEFVLNFLKTNCPYVNEDDEEEKLAREEYTNANIEKINIDSVTVFIPTGHVQAWKTVLDKNYGAVLNLPTKYGASPVQFKTEAGVSITVWVKEKSIRSTLLIEGQENYLNFASKQLPKVFIEVAKFINIF